MLLTTACFAQEYFGTTTFGDNSIDIPYHSAMDSNGNVYSVGLYSGAITVGSETITWAGGNADGYLTKYDNDANPIWVKGFGGGFDDVAIDVAIDGNDNIYLTGYFQGSGVNSFDADPGPGVYQLSQPAPFLSRDCFIIKLDSNGDFVWAKQVSNPAAVANEDATSIIVDDAGNVYVGGSFRYADFDPSPTGDVTLLSTGGGASPDGFLLKLDTDGNYVWVKTFASTGIVEVESLDFDDNGNILMAGRFRDTVDLDPNAGVAEFTFNGGDDIFMAKLDADGNYIWGQGFGSPGLDIISSIINLPSGVYVNGMFSETADLDPSTGENIVTAVGPWDAFSSRFDTDGNYETSYVLGGEGTDFENVYDVKEGPNGNLFLTGAFNGTTDFDNSTAEALSTTNGMSDNFLLELTMAGAYLNHWTIGGNMQELNAQLYFNDQNQVLTLGAFRSSNLDFNPFDGIDVHDTNGHYDNYFSKYYLFNVANDGCEDAIPLVCGDTVTGETINDTDSGGNAANDEFFSFTGNGTAELVTISLCDGGTDFDTVLRVFEDCTLTNEIAFNDDSCGLQSEVSFGSNGTDTYYIMVEGFGSAAGNFTLSVSCIDTAENDSCEDALPIACGETITGTTTNATFDADAPVCGTTITAPGVWYEFTDTSGFISDYTVSLCDGGTDFDSKISIYTGDCGALVCVTDNDDSCGLQSEASFQGDGNTTYYILVHGFGTSIGNFSLNVSCTPVPPANDMIANSVDIDDLGCPYTDIAVTTPTATTEAGSPSGCDINGVNGVWYNYTPEGNGFITLTISNPGGFSSVTFYEAPNENATENDLTLVNYYLNQCLPGTTATIPVVDGQTYYAFVANTDATTDIVFDCDILGVNDTTLEGFTYFPNPVTNTLHLNAQDIIENVIVYNMIGQKVLEEKTDRINTELNLSNLQTGTYILEVSSKGTTGVYRIIKD
ncbi:hypothetical protein GCM10008083_12240 [Ulvibacter litoralis]|nr:hypothetical protein GCM10008083_12240 [Ulvibacter litoralis]